MDAVIARPSTNLTRPFLISAAVAVAGIVINVMVMRIGGLHTLTVRYAFAAAETGDLALLAIFIPLTCRMVDQRGMHIAALMAPHAIASVIALTLVFLPTPMLVTAVAIALGYCGRRSGFLAYVPLPPLVCVVAAELSVACAMLFVH